MQETGVQNIKILPISWNCYKKVREKFPLKRFPVVNMHIFTEVFLQSICALLTQRVLTEENLLAFP